MEDAVIVSAALRTPVSSAAVKGRPRSSQHSQPVERGRHTWGADPMGIVSAAPRLVPLARSGASTCLRFPTLRSGSSRSNTRWLTDWLGFDVVDAPLVTDAALERCSTALVEAIRKLAMSGGGPVDADTFVGEASFRAALYAAGGACQMVERLLDGDARLGFSGLRPAGHHAECDRAMGFCRSTTWRSPAESAIVDHGLNRQNPIGPVHWRWSASRSKTAEAESRISIQQPLDRRHKRRRPPFSAARNNTTSARRLDPRRTWPACGLLRREPCCGPAR